MPSEAAIKIAKRVAQILDGDPNSNKWHGSYVETWLVEGFSTDQIIAAADTVRGRGTEVGSIKYLESILKDTEGGNTNQPFKPSGEPQVRDAESVAEVIEYRTAKKLPVTEEITSARTVAGLPAYARKVPVNVVRLRREA